VWAVIVPALMAYKSRQQFPNHQSFRVFGGTPLIILVVLYGVVTGACHLLAMANLLPQFS
jgi:tryptophan-specific transport protein